MPEKSVNKVVLAYSGGLDTSVNLRWIKEKYGAEIIAYTTDLGQGEELSGLEEKAIAINGQEIPIRADTICLHSDTPGAVELARKIRERMEAAGVEVVPMSNFL